MMCSFAQIFHSSGFTRKYTLAQDKLDLAPSVWRRCEAITPGLQPSLWKHFGLFMPVPGLFLVFKTFHPRHVGQRITLLSALITAVLYSDADAAKVMQSLGVKGPLNIQERLV